MRRVTSTVLAVGTTLLLSLIAASGRPHDPENVLTVYDAAPAHLWNRLYAALMVRQDRDGKQVEEDALDPLLWPETEHLLSEPSHGQAIRLLDEFLHTHGETLIHDPVKRAMLQRDLWAVFDWSVAQFSANKRPNYDRQKRELQLRLAEALRRLALSPDEIKSLPDTYAQAVASGAFARQYDPNAPERPFLPTDLLDPNGPWVCIQPSPESDAGVARIHLQAFSARSSFFVFVRLPGGRQATYDYFRSLWNFSQPYVQGPEFARDQAPINPDLPSFPPGTQVALVRRVTLIDNQGNLVSSSITESVQLRVYRAITDTQERFLGNGGIAEMIKNGGQDFFEVRLSRPLLFGGKNGGLRAVTREEKNFRIFETQGDDPLEDGHGRPDPGDVPTTLQTCAWCHSGGGVRSLNSRQALLRPNRMQMEPKDPAYGPMYWGDGAAIAWKQNHYDWGLLNGYWLAAPQR